MHPSHIIFWERKPYANDFTAPGNTTAGVKVKMSGLAKTAACYLDTFLTLNNTYENKNLKIIFHVNTDIATSIKYQIILHTIHLVVNLYNTWQTKFKMHKYTFNSEITW